MRRSSLFGSIRARMTLAFCVSIGLLLFCASSALIMYITSDIEGDADHTLRAIAQNVQHEMVGEHETDIVRIMAHEKRVYGEEFAATVVDAGGRVLQRSQADSPGASGASGDAWRTVRQPLGGQAAIIGMSWARPGAALRAQKTEIVLFSLLILLFTTVGAWAMVGRTLSPIGKLSHQAQEASGASRDMRLTAPSNDAEIVELVGTLNAMLARLEEAGARQGRFYAAASHELRTPLQALSGHLELAASRPRSEEAYRAVIAEAHAQTARLVSLTRDLLLLNQLEGGKLPDAVSVSMAEVCRRGLQQVEDIIKDNELTVTARVPPDLVLTVPPGHIEMVARNLLENAAKYADRCGELKLQADSDTMEIYNTCRHNPDWSPERTFEAFYRPDASRSKATGGNGLGLAICKAICVLNGWPIQVRQVPGGVRAAVNYGANGRQSAGTAVVIPGEGKETE